MKRHLASKYYTNTTRPTSASGVCVAVEWTPAFLSLLVIIFMLSLHINPSFLLPLELCASCTTLKIGPSQFCIHVAVSVAQSVKLPELRSLKEVQLN